MSVSLRSLNERVASPERPGARVASPTSAALWALGAVVLLGALIRFSTIGEQSFWYDEAFTYSIVGHGLGHVLQTVPKTESTPPLYYVVLWFWSRAFGIREAGLRSFSALCGTLTIPLMWDLGRRTIGTRVGFAAALLTAVNPVLFWYSQEARAYSLLVLLSAAGLLTLLRALERPTIGRLLAWGIASAAALCTHYFAVFVIVPEAFWLGAALRRRGALTLGGTAAALVPVVAMGVALLPLLAHQNDGRASSLATGGGSIESRVAQLVRQDLLGFGQPHKALIAAAAGLLLAGALALLVFRSSAGERRASMLPAVVGGGGLLLALIVSELSTDYFVTRNLLPTWPALALLVAIAFGVRRGGRLAIGGLGALAAISLVCIGTVVAEPTLQRPDWRGAARAIGPPSAERAIVGDRLAYRSLQPYLPRISSYPAGGAVVGEIDVVDATASQADAQNESMPSPAPPPGFALVRRAKTAGYIVASYRASSPKREPEGALVRLGPINGEDQAMLQPASG